MHCALQVAYLAILADIMSESANALIPPGAEPSRPQYVAGTVLVLLLPLSCAVRVCGNAALPKHGNSNQQRGPPRP